MYKRLSAHCSIFSPFACPCFGGHQRDRSSFGVPLAPSLPQNVSGQSLVGTRPPSQPCGGTHLRPHNATRPWQGHLSWTPALLPQQCSLGSEQSQPCPSSLPPSVQESTGKAGERGAEGCPGGLQETKMGGSTFWAGRRQGAEQQTESG